MPEISLDRVDGGVDVPRMNVVFIHGLGGDPIAYWRHEEGEESDFFWLRQLAEDIPGIAVWTIGYPADKTLWGSGWPIAEAATAILDKFISSRKFQATGDVPIALICHSLGGIIAKKLVLTAYLDRGQQPARGRFLDRVYGIVFLATPHSGSIISSIASTARWFVSETMNDLNASNASLLDLNYTYRDRIANGEAHILHRVYYEGVGIWGAEVVTPASADPGLPGVRPVKVNRNHTQIQRPTHQQDVVYEGVLAFLQDEILQPRPASEKQQEEWQREMVARIEAVEKFTRKIQNIEARMDGFVSLKMTDDRAEVDYFKEKGLVGAIKSAEYGASIGDERCRLAVSFFNSGKILESEAIFRELAEEMEQKSREATKKAAFAYRNLGAVAALRDPSGAINAYKTALRFNPDDLESIICIGNIQKECSNLVEAADRFRTVLSIDEPDRTS